jgi:hypothetical protein
LFIGRDEMTALIAGLPAGSASFLTFAAARKSKKKKH